jgi:hypothetical protein
MTKLNNVSLRQELLAICKNLHIEDAGRITYHGIYSRQFVHGETVQNQISETGNLEAANLSRAIANLLYDCCYIRDSRDELVRAEKSPVSGGSTVRNLTGDLQQANATQETWDHGWKIYQISSNGKIFVQKGDRSRSAVAGTYALQKWSVQGPKTGNLVSLRIFPSTSELQEAFFHSFGTTPADQFDEFSAIRFYFNITAEAATLLLSTLSEQLNRYQIPFHFKTLTNSGGYYRADAAVLYLAKRYYAIVASLLIEVHAVLGKGIKPETPLFSWRYLPGIGVAEDPGTGESFGMHRCQLLAEGICDAWSAGFQDAENRIAAIEQGFTAAGLNLETAYLNPGSVDIFKQAIYVGGE